MLSKDQIRFGLMVWLGAAPEASLNAVKFCFDANICLLWLTDAEEQTELLSASSSALFLSCKREKNNNTKYK